MFLVSNKLVELPSLPRCYRGKLGSSTSLFDEGRVSIHWFPALRPSEPSWAVSLPVGFCHPQSLSPFIITQPKS